MSNKYHGLIPINKEDIAEAVIKRHLRIIGKGFNNSIDVEDCFKHSRDEWFVPLNYAVTEELLTEDNDPRPTIEVKWPKSPRFVGRHNQEEVISHTVRHLKKYSCGRISAPTGWGKTMTALQIAKELKTNVLYLVHKNDVLKQVKKVAKQFFHIKKCGEIKGDKEETHQIITLCTMQTAALRVEENPNYLDKFGLMICDESHRCSCKSFIKILCGFNSRYKLGISATHRRSDGLSGVYEAFLGGLIAEGKVDEPRIPMLEAPVVQVNASMRDFFDWRGEVSHTKALTTIAEDCLYNVWLIKKILQVVKNGRRPLVTTDRKVQLEILQNRLIAEGIEVGIYAGGKHRGPMTEEEILEAYLKQHKRNAIKAYRVSLGKKETYKKKEFDAQYMEPTPSKCELDEFYVTYEGNTITEADLAEAMTKQVILATTKKVGEGFDEENFLGAKVFAAQQPMDTIIIASMTKDSTQVIGRISRSQRAKHPLIIHPIPNIGYCHAMFKKCYKMSYLPEGIKAEEN
jgi:hypothetical protein